MSTPRSWSVVAQKELKQAGKEPSLHQKLETARHQLKAAQNQHWDSETTAYLQQRVDGFTSQLAAQQPAWQRLQGTKKRLRAAADRAEEAVAAVQKWTVELENARAEMASIQKEHAALETEAAHTLARGTMPRQRQHMPTLAKSLQQTLSNLAEAVESIWVAGSNGLAEQGGVPVRLANALQATHATLAQLTEPADDSVSISDMEMDETEVNVGEEAPAETPRGQLPQAMQEPAVSAAELMRQSLDENQQHLPESSASGLSTPLSKARPRSRPRQNRRRGEQEQEQPIERSRGRSRTPPGIDGAAIAEEIAAARHQCSQAAAAPANLTA